MLKKLMLVISLSLCTFSYLSAGEISTGVEVSPHLFFPLEDNYYLQGINDQGLAFGGNINFLFAFPKLSWMTFGIDTTIDDLNLNFVKDDLWEMDSFNYNYNLLLLSMGLSAQAAYPLGNRFSLFGKGHISGYYGKLIGDYGSDAFDIAYGASAGFGFNLSKWFKLTASGGYEIYSPDFRGITATLSLISRISGAGSNSIPRKDYLPRNRNRIATSGYISIDNTELISIYPVLFKYYDQKPIGHTVISNKSNHELKDLKVSLRVNKFMDAPKVSKSLPLLSSGESFEVDLFALFSDEILSVTEGTKLAAEVTVSYMLDEVECFDTRTVTMDIYDRNSIKWDDDRKIASFITSKDSEIQKYSRNIASLIRTSGTDSINKELQLGIAMLGAMNIQNCVYSVDPSSSYLELSKDSAQVDTVQFPRQTLEYRAGDCDDLMVTYTALLEAVGVETAFITIPGHIYSAFRVNMTQRDVERYFSRPGDFIYGEDGSVWVPVETTILSEGFLRAWAVGSREWNDNNAKGQSTLYRTREAWEEYNPVAFSVSTSTLESPDTRLMVEYFSNELNKLINREISIQEGALNARLEQNPGDPILLNKAGILYARYGKNTEAQGYFERSIAARSDYLPAMINLGNLAFLDNDFLKARDLFNKALSLSPGKAAAQLGLVRISYELGDLSGLEKQYEKLKEMSLPLAEKYAYLVEESTTTTRASDAARNSSMMDWAEEDE